jgi:hypothetical protein
MPLSNDDVYIEFQCDNCKLKLLVTVGEIISGGNPVCRNCDSPFEMEPTDRILIPEYGDSP